MTGIHHSPQEEPWRLPGTSARDSGELPSPRSTALTGTATIDIGKDDLRPDQIPEWRKIFMPYENLASNEDIANRALGFATQIYRDHDEQTQGIRNVWYAIEMLYRGRTLAPNPNGVKLAEIYKTIEILAPRLEDPFLESDPWFSVDGVTQIDNQKAAKIEALLRSQVGRNRFDTQIVQEASREILKKNQLIIKTSWLHDVRNVVRRNPKRETLPEGKGFRFTFRREEKEEIVYQGPDASFVSSWNYIQDPREPDPQKALYVGDICDMTFDEIATLGERGFFENWEALKGQTRQESPTMSGSMEAATKSTAPFSYLPDVRTVDGGAQNFPVLELWCRFDAFDEGRTREFVITIANWNTVLRVQENFYDDKHRPYCFARISKDSHDTYGVGPIEHCVPVQTSMDKHHQIAEKAHELSAFPPMVSNDDEFEESWWDIEPGQVLQGNPNAIQQLKIQSSLRDIDYIVNQLRREIEEIAGAPRTFAGTEEPSQTATQYQGRIEEGNRRTRGIITSLGSFFEQVVTQFHSLNRQFMSQMQTIRTLGRQGFNLGDYAWIGPDDIDADVSIRIRALKGLQQRGMRATNATQLMQVALPALQGNPGVVDIPELLKIVTDGLLGPGYSDRLIKGPEPANELIPQMYETEIMLREERYLDVHPQDNDEEHMAFLEAIFDDEAYESLADNVKSILQMHYNAHMAQASSKSSQSQSAANFVPSAAASSLVAPGDGTAPSTLADAQQTPGQTTGETPGPISVARQGTPGREQPIPQTMNQFGG